MHLKQFRGVQGLVWVSPHSPFGTYILLVLHFGIGSFSHSCTTNWVPTPRSTTSLPLLVLPYHPRCRAVLPSVGYGFAMAFARGDGLHCVRIRNGICPESRFTWQPSTT